MFSLFKHTSVSKVPTKNRSRYVTLNSGLNATELSHLDPFIFYRRRQYLKQIEYDNKLKDNFFYDYIKKYIEAYKNLSGGDKIQELRKDVIQARNKIGSIDKIYAGNKLLNERPILSLFLHASYHDKKDFRVPWLQDHFREMFKPYEITPLKVDVILIANAALGDTEYIMTEQEKNEYNKIIINLKYTSFLNKTLQQKQIDSVTQELRNFQTRLFTERAVNCREKIKSEEREVNLFLNIKEKIIKMGKVVPQEIEETNTKRQENIIKQTHNLKRYERFIESMRNKFQVYYLKKGSTINKIIHKDPVNTQGIFELENKTNLYNDFLTDAMKRDYFKTPETTYVNLDRFINFYYDHYSLKPKNIIIIDNTCSEFHSNGIKVNKDKIKKFKQSREKRSFEKNNSHSKNLHSNHLHSRKYKSLSLNTKSQTRNQSRKIKRSNPLTNEEIVDIQQKQKGIMNNIEIQEELNKMKVRSRSRSRSGSRSGSRSQTRSKSYGKPQNYTYPHENVYEELKKSLTNKE